MRRRFVKGTITKTTGGNHSMYSNGNIVTNAGGFIRETADNQIIYGDPEDAPEPTAKKLINSIISGYFYTKEGVYLGKIGNGNNVYITDQATFLEVQKGKDVGNRMKILKLFENNLIHKDLLIYGGIVNGEATNQNSTDIGITVEELKIERFCIANCIYNFMKNKNKKKLSELSPSYSYAKKDKIPAYKLITNSEENSRDNQWVKIAISSVINAVLEEHDYSNDSSYWDGPDVMTGNFAGGYDPSKHFRQKPLNGDEYRVQGIFDPKNLSDKFFKNAQSYYTKYDSHRAPYLKYLTKYAKQEHFDIATIDPSEVKMKLKAVDSVKDVSFNKKNTLLEGIGTGAFKVTIKCLWEIRMQSACSVFYKQLNNKY